MIKEHIFPTKRAGFIRVFLSLIFLFTFVLQMQSRENQDKSKITIHQSHVPITKIFEAIENESDYIFVYDDKTIDKHRIVSIDCDNVTVKQAMDILFKNGGVHYILADRQIILQKKEDESPDLKKDRYLVSGKVITSDGEPLAGASVYVRESTSLGSMSDADGNFSIPNVPLNVTLIFNYIGFVKVERKFEGQKELVIIMLEDQLDLDEVTVVAFGRQKKESVIASISTIKPSDLKIPTSNLTTSFAGRAAGLISFQRSGEPGSDNASFFVRGITTFGANQNPLILIDNIELSTTDLAQLQPDDIESFSIMKDATATALYGARGANGVILVKTKGGHVGKIKTTIRIENSVSSPTRNLKLADPITYMKLHNEAITTREPLAQKLYSDDKIYNTVPGSGSYIYPTTDWNEELLKNRTMNQRVNLSISGGGDLVTYYITGSYTHDTGILKVDSRNNFNNGITNNVLTLRSNINLKPTKTTEISSRFNGSFKDYTGPIYSGSDMYSLIMRSNPVLFPAYYQPDNEHLHTNHILFGNVQLGNSFHINPYAEMVKGYKESGRSNLSAQFEVTQDFNFLTEGLSARALFNVLRISSHSINRFYNPFWYGLGAYDRLSNTYSIVNLNPDTGTDYLNYAREIGVPTSNLYFEGSVNYNRAFDIHNISGMLVYQLRNNVSLAASSVQGSLPYRNVGLSGRFTYGYDNRYLLEFNFGYNGSERFYKDNQFGFFPSGGIAWNISNEKWFSSLNDYIRLLKLRASYGLVGNDEISSERFLYLSEINMDNADLRQYFGLERAYSNVGISVNRYSDPDITWEKSKKANIALELELRNGFSLIGEYYTEKRTNILLTRSNIPSTMGLWVTPKSNVGEAKAHGFDLSLKYDKSFNKDTWLQLMGNYTFARSEYSIYDELHYEDEWWLSRVGYSINQNWGYIAERLFIDENEVANSPTQFGAYIAGDIKYRDVNNDGQITTLDRVPIGYPTTPEIIYGFGASFGYKNYDVSVFFQGLANESFWISYGQTSPFFSNNEGGLIGTNQLARFISDSHWDEDSRDIYALWPRLSTSSISNNAQTSTWFMRDGSFLRLKSVEVGYTIPGALSNKIKLQNARIYFSGTNLFTWSKFDLWDVEQGSSAFNYPIQCVFNVGLNVTF
jgi:TonB-linked SusC/RagA family outer membrane protein